jgi:uncharacterized protein with GYD domain
MPPDSSPLLQHRSLPQPRCSQIPGKLADAVSSKIKKECKSVTWKQSFATLGRFDVVDVVEADDPKDIEKAAMIIRSHGHSITETLVATPWKEFLAAL